MSARRPPELDCLAVTGCTLCGTPVQRLYAKLIDGRRVVFDMPVYGDDKLTETETGILAVLAASAVPMKRLSVAKKLGRQDCKGSFGEAFRGLVRSGRIVRRDEGYVETKGTGVQYPGHRRDTAGHLPGM